MDKVPKGGIRTKKSRPLRYASRKDAAIFARYRVKISELYEKELRKRGLTDVPVAYRKLKRNNGGNKSNIEISKEVFDFIRAQENCVVTVVDIKSYFESLDHARLKSVWEMLLGQALPRDHLAIFNAVTRYSVVDVNRLFERLELHEAGIGDSRREKRMRKIDKLRENGYAQICSPEDFRAFVGGSVSNKPSLIQKNGFDFGIPQGTPISDLLANIYLIVFDEEINHWVSQLGGLYRRYSDDIIIILPGSAACDEFLAKRHLQRQIRKYGQQIRIQDRKVSIVRFLKNNSKIDFIHIDGKASRNGLEYLGFEFDGESIKIKNATLSNALEKT